MASRTHLPPGPRTVARAMRRLAGALLLAGAYLASAGCAGAIRSPALPGAAEIPVLEARLVRDSADVGALVRLGVAYREAGRTSEAGVPLERAVRLEPRDAAAVFYLGLTYEDLDEPQRARQLYEQYLSIGRNAALKAQLRARLPLLERQAWRLAAREALQREAELSTAAPTPGTIAVYPFHSLGTDPDLRPLGRALAELLVTDLSQSPRLRVLERAQVQALLDEAALSESQFVDPATALRGGRLLRAARVLQGQIGQHGDDLNVGAAIVSVEGRSEAQRLTEQDALPRLFDLQKRLALGVFAELGIELTPAERAQVLQRPTEHLQALLAYGLGLEAADVGDFARAAQHFTEAASLDPQFRLARDAALEAAAAAAASRTSTAQLGRQALREITVELDVPDLTLDFLPDLGGRDPAAEILGREGVGERSTLLELIIRRP
jgi:TolB-like protein